MNLLLTRRVRTLPALLEMTYVLFPDPPVTFLLEGHRSPYWGLIIPLPLKKFYHVCIA